MSMKRSDRSRLALRVRRCVKRPFWQGRDRHGHVCLASTLTCIASGVLGLLPPSALAAGSCPNEQVRAEDHSSLLPDCRAYELVSPAYKEGHPVVVNHAGYVSRDGTHLIATSLGVFAGSEDDPPGEEGAGGASYEFSRTPAGWATNPLVPPASQFAEDAFSRTLISSDFGTTTFVLNTPSQFVQQRDLYLRRPDGSFTRVGPMTPPGANNNNDQKPEAGSSDLSHVLFTLFQSRWRGDTTELLQPSLYQLVNGAGSEEPKLVGVKNNSPLASNSEAQLIGDCGTVLGGKEKEGAKSEVQADAVSSSGETVIFTTLGCGSSPPVNELYARFDGSTTVAISEPSPAQCSSPACIKVEEGERQEGFFEGASEDGGTVYFTTAQPLLNSDTDTTKDLYETAITGSGIQKLIQVSEGDASDATRGSGAQVLGVSAISQDGSRVYFVAEGVLTTTKNIQGQEATKGVPNLYMAEPGHAGPAGVPTTFITTLLSSDSEDWVPGGEKASAGQAVTSTPDGRYLVFSNAEQILEYDSQTRALVRAASNGFAPRVSDNGAFIFFESRTALASQAVAGNTHVYEYHAGGVSLISDGQDAQGEGARLIGTDASGEDVFFETLDPLVRQDTDTQLDIYDARVGGGFPAPVLATGCSGDGCQGSSSIPPVLPVANTRTAEGGNLAPPVSKPVIKPLTNAQKLVRALKVCRTKHNKHQRAICEAQARHKYGPPHKAKKATRRVN